MRHRHSAASVIALASLGMMSPASAQTTSDTLVQRPAALEEIVVTAQKREENLQCVPIAVAAISGDTLNARGLGHIEDRMETQAMIIALIEQGPDMSLAGRAERLISNKHTALKRMTVRFTPRARMTA